MLTPSGDSSQSSRRLTIFIAAFDERYTKNPGEPTRPSWWPEIVVSISGEGSSVHFEAFCRQKCTAIRGK